MISPVTADAAAIEVRGLRKSYGLTEAVRGIDFRVERGEVFGLLGPNALGKTVLLTTHYLDEAQALADRVAIVKDGRILAEGAPGELGAGDARYRVAWRNGTGETLVHETDDP